MISRFHIMNSLAESFVVSRSVPSKSKFVSLKLSNILKTVCLRKCTAVDCSSTAHLHLFLYFQLSKGPYRILKKCVTHPLQKLQLRVWFNCGTAISSWTDRILSAFSHLPRPSCTSLPDLYTWTCAVRQQICCNLPFPK